MSLNPAGDHGHLLENLVFLHLHRKGYHLTYVITKSGENEIDFLAYDPVTKEKQLVQICFTMSAPATLERELASFRKAADYLGVSKKIIVTWEEEAVFDGDIQAVPAWKFLLDRCWDCFFTTTAVLTAQKRLATAFYRAAPALTRLPRHCALVVPGNAFWGELWRGRAAPARLSEP